MRVSVLAFFLLLPVTAAAQTAEQATAAKAIQEKRDALTPEAQRRTVEILDSRIETLDRQARTLDIRFDAARAAEVRREPMRNRESSENIAKRSEEIREVRETFVQTRTVVANGDVNVIPVTQLPLVLEALAQVSGPLFMVCGPAIWAPADPSDYKTALNRHLDALLQIGRSVGRIGISTDVEPAVGTGFMVGPRHFITNRHVLERGRFASKDAQTGVWRLRESPATIVRFEQEFDLRGTNGCPQVPVSYKVRVADVVVPDDAVDLAVLILDPAGEGGVRLPPALRIQLRTADYYRNAANVAVIGYPGRPNDMTITQFNEFFRSPFGTAGEVDIKRLSPGETKYQQNLSPMVFRYNSNTTPGNSGSPVIDVADRAIVGVHYAGLARTDTADGVNYGIVSAVTQSIIDAALRAVPQ